MISIVFKLMRFRDEWLKVGKAKSYNEKNNKIEPIHLVLIEEPEAHLHVQVQQVFIQNAYDVLTNTGLCIDTRSLQTQLIVSSHSSHIARETSFKNMRYFKRISLPQKAGITNIVNLSDVFGDEDDTAKFVTRYLKSTHCDLFFADAIIAIEGTSESILLPHFIKNNFPSLANRYISILNVGGKHIHRFERLLNKLALPTLIIADIDNGKHSVGKNNKKVCTKVAGFKGDNQVSTNYSVYEWMMKEKFIDMLLEKSFNEKVKTFPLTDDTLLKYQVRIAYQTLINIECNGEMHEVAPRTFEDALIYTNWKHIVLETEQENFSDKTNAFSSIRELYKETNKTDIKALHQKIFEEVNSKNFKASFAIDIMYDFELSEIVLPDYIDEAFKWLEAQLERGE